MSTISEAVSAKTQAFSAHYLTGCGIDFVEAAEAHMRWRSRLQGHIDGMASDTWSPVDASVGDHCGLGRWLRGIGRVRYGYLSAFRQLEVEHVEFHRFAGLVLAKVLEQDQLGAEALLREEFAQATRRILIAMNELNEAIQAGA